MKLPESLYFLRVGWWLVHVVGVGAVFVLGFVASEHLTAHGAHEGHGGGGAHEGHGAGAHDHTSPEVLRPLMRQMLADWVQLQGALSEGDLAVAATHADAIAGACEGEGGNEDVALPARLGPAFLEHDRELHGSTSRLAEALRAGRRDEARSLSGEIVSTCQSCHNQAPAASEVNLRVLTSFANTLVEAKGDTP